MPHPHPKYSGLGLSAISDREGKDFNQSSLTWHIEQLKKGVQLEPLLLDYRHPFRGYPSHEGRHRAMAAKRLGIEKVPVVVERDRTKRYMILRKLNDGSLVNLYPQRDGMEPDAYSLQGARAQVEYLSNMFGERFEILPRSKALKHEVPKRW